MRMTPFSSALRRLSTKRIASPMLCGCFLVLAHLDAPRPISVMPNLKCWKLLLARVAAFVSLRSKPLWQGGPGRVFSALKQAARRVVGLAASLSLCRCAPNRFCRVVLAERFPPLSRNVLSPPLLSLRMFLAQCIPDRCIYVE
jgi:hypothetical protein